MRSQYISALKNEIRSRLGERQEMDGGVRITSVFFGGGTPTVLTGEELAGILDTVRYLAKIDDGAEITCEANPCTLDFEKARILRDSGFNRLSIGAQSMRDGNLKLLGRLHDKAGFYRAFEDARRAGFSNLNLDMIFGLPGQTAREWEEELGEAASLKSEHISAYALELCEGTPLCAARDRYEWPSEEELREMYDLTGQLLAGRGFNHYEISNYAKPGFESRHNSGYWTGDEYLGFGLGASSYEFEIGQRASHFVQFGQSDWHAVQFRRHAVPKCAVRYKNTSDVSEYIKNSSVPYALRTDVQVLDKRDLESEYMILGLRMTKGVSENTFSQRFKEDVDDVFGEVIRKYVKAGFLIREGGQIRLAGKAMFVSNAILAEFIDP